MEYQSNKYSNNTLNINSNYKGNHNNKIEKLEKIIENKNILIEQYQELVESCYEKLKKYKQDNINLRNEMEKYSLNEINYRKERKNENNQNENMENNIIYNEEIPFDANLKGRKTKLKSKNDNSDLNNKNNYEIKQIQHLGEELNELISLNKKNQEKYETKLGNLINKLENLGNKFQ